MKFYYNLGSDKRITFFSVLPPENTNPATETGEIDLPENNGVILGQHAIIKGSLVFLGPTQEMLDREEERIRKWRIAELRSFLRSTDYKVIKNQELLAAGLQPEYNPAELHSQRQAWRDELNQLLESEEN